MSKRVDVSRRNFLKGTLGAGAAVLFAGGTSSLLSACSSDSKAVLPQYGVFRNQLFWLRNVTAAPGFLGMERKVWEKQGFSGVELLAGGPSVDTKSSLLTDKADMAGVDSLSFAAAAERDQLVCIGARLTKSPLCITSLASSPIRVPTDLRGKRIGVQPVYERVWSVFLKVNNIDESSVTRVTVQYDPQPLQDGQVDGFFSWIVNQSVSLRVRNVPYVNMMFADFNFTLFEDLRVVTKKSLEQTRDRVKAGLRGELIAQLMFLRDYELGRELALTKYASDVPDDPNFARLNSSEVRDFIHSQDVVRTNGLGWMTPEAVSRTVETLASAGVVVDPRLYDNSLMQEIYEDGPDLLARFEKE